MTARIDLPLCRLLLVASLLAIGLGLSSAARATAIAHADAMAGVTLVSCVPSCAGVGLTVSAETVEPLSPAPSDGTTASGGGVASTAGSTRSPAPGAPVLLTPGEALTLTSMADAQAGVPVASSADAFFFSGGSLELFNGGAASVAVTLSIEVSSSAEVTVTDAVNEEAFALSDLLVELIDPLAIETLVDEQLIADTTTGEIGGSFFDTLSRTIILAANDTAILAVVIADAEATTSAEAVPVPEPTPLALLAIALVAPGLVRYGALRR